MPAEWQTGVVVPIFLTGVCCSFMGITQIDADSTLPAEQPFRVFGTLSWEFVHLGA